MPRKTNITADLATMISKLVVEYQPEKVMLFGSRARGDNRSDSDIDLLIIKNTSQKLLDRWTTVRRILSDPHRKIPLETLILTPKEIEDRLAVGDQFVAEIMATGKVLYAA
jgi:predicted nucleotidyltransferase